MFPAASVTRKVLVVVPSGKVDPEGIPDTNIRLLESLGLEYCQEVLRKIKLKNPG